MCQNDGVVFLASKLQLIYTNLFINRRDQLCKAVLLFFCCRSGSAFCIYLSNSRFHYAVECSECTLLHFSANSLQSIVFNNYLKIKNRHWSILHMPNGYHYNIFIDGCMQYTSARCTTNGAATLATRNINNNKVSDLKNNNLQKNDEKNFYLALEHTISRDMSCTSRNQYPKSAGNIPHRLPRQLHEQYKLIRRFHCNKRWIGRC